MKCWCIINLFFLNEFRFFKGRSIARMDKGRGPMAFYDREGDAEAELFRLQQKHPGGEYVIFEAVKQVIRSNVDQGFWHLERVD